VDTYKGTNTTNGKFYVGSTTNFEERKKQHLRSTKNYPFQNALRNNPEAFEWEVWSDDSNEPILEQALLDMWCGTEQCYNLNPHAGRPHLTREQRSSLGKRTHDLHPELAKHRGETWGSKAGKTTHILHPGQASQNGKRTHELHPNRASEWGKKMGAKRAKRVICTYSGGEKEEFCSIREGSRTTGASVSAILKCCSGEFKQTKGLKWEWAA
jgi:group I intron endonuclease